MHCSFLTLHATEVFTNLSINCSSGTSTVLRELDCKGSSLHDLKDVMRPSTNSQLASSHLRHLAKRGRKGKQRAAPAKKAEAALAKMATQRACVHVCHVPHALCDARHSRARVRVRCYAIHATLCGLPSSLTLFAIPSRTFYASFHDILRLDRDDAAQWRSNQQHWFLHPSGSSLTCPRLSRQTPPSCCSQLALPSRCSQHTLLLHCSQQAVVSLPHPGPTELLQPLLPQMVVLLPTRLAAPSHATSPGPHRRSSNLSRGPRRCHARIPCQRLNHQISQKQIPLLFHLPTPHRAT